ncbi:hypothetical protein EYB53_010935 [Candidatus Chloroploca sp. M-50]|uniref:DUF2063 domain-containing protein n=1 Tax=Candidatus Chloroploca mongolica TaxID=2528176 RepID=A0ABS4D9Y8_9CHLR|nr:hypothetical protein [Candidatus Chloroploca mongolica]MBP1466220.1 hypothetical protein [Candidatus Chloroploca mongolica]
MRPTPQRAPHPRVKRRRRVVRRSATEAITRLAASEHLAAIHYGREAAALIRHRFPAFYAAHVADLPTTPPYLLGVIQAFFSLVQPQIWLDHSHVLTIDPDDPRRVLHPALSDDDARSYLEEFHGWGLDEVWPEVYGLPTEQDELFGEGRNLLVAVLWSMADRTAWSATLGDMDDVIAAWGDQVALSPAHSAALANLPHLEPTTDMEALCTALSTQPFPLPDGTAIDLGQVVRFVFSRTDNWFADLSWDELADMNGSGLDWWSDDLIAIAADQTAARGWFEHYHLLNRIVTAEPAVLRAVITAVQQAAQSIAPHPGTPSA